MLEKPSLIQFPKIGNTPLGYISLAEKDTLPFEVKRIYWTYFTPENIERGGHAHYQLVQILVAVAGTITVFTEMPDGRKNEFFLDSADKGVLFPNYCWHRMKYSHNAVQMCIASMAYDEEDYIRDYEKFKKLNIES